MLIMYFLLIKLIPNFYDIVHNVFTITSYVLKFYFLFYFFNNPKFKKLSSGYDC
jgi:hypothetical protein